MESTRNDETNFYLVTERRERHIYIFYLPEHLINTQENRTGIEE